MSVCWSCSEGSPHCGGFWFVHRCLYRIEEVYCSSWKANPLIMSDHGTNYVGTSHEIKELFEFLAELNTQKLIPDFCASQLIQWQFIPERAPHFGGLWSEAAVRSMKKHTHCVIGPVKLTFEELTMVLSQIEACLNSRQLLSLPPDNNGNEALTPGHFITGRPLEALPDPSVSFESISLLRHFQLCQALVRHVWKCWSTEYLSCLRRVPKWHRRTRNVSVGDVVLMRDDGLVSTRWPLAHVIGCTLTRMVLYVSLSWEAPLVFMSDWSLR